MSKNSLKYVLASIVVFSFNSINKLFAFISVKGFDFFNIISSSCANKFSSIAVKKLILI